MNVPAYAHLFVSLGGDRARGPVRSVLLHPSGGGITSYLQLAIHLARRGLVAAIRAEGLLPGERPHDDINVMVDAYAPVLTALPERSNLLVGWSMGGVLAWELAGRLAESGSAPAVVVIDSVAEAVAADHLAELRRLVLAHATATLGNAISNEIVATVDAHVQASVGHRVTNRHSGEALLLACGDEDVSARLGDWGALGERLRIQRLPGEHFDVFSPDVLPVLLHHVDDFLDDVFATEGAK